MYYDHRMMMMVNKMYNIGDDIFRTRHHRNGSGRGRRILIPEVLNCFARRITIAKTEFHFLLVNQKVANYTSQDATRQKKDTKHT